MLRMVNLLMALSLGVHREQLEQRMGFTWPRPFLLRPLFFLCSTSGRSAFAQRRNCRARLATVGRGGDKATERTSMHGCEYDPSVASIHPGHRDDVYLVLERVLLGANHTFLGILTTLADENRKCWSLKERGGGSKGDLWKFNGGLLAAAGTPKQKWRSTTGNTGP